MNAITLRECESVTRMIAIWGSCAAAVVFGVGFLTDEALTYRLVIGQAEQIALIAIMFIGYLLAGTRRFEVLGSVVALLAVAAYWTWCQIQDAEILRPIFLVVAAPALFHLLAVIVRRMSVRYHCD